MISFFGRMEKKRYLELDILQILEDFIFIIGFICKLIGLNGLDYILRSDIQITHNWRVVTILIIIIRFMYLLCTCEVYSLFAVDKIHRLNPLTVKTC